MSIDISGRVDEAVPLPAVVAMAWGVMAGAIHLLVAPAHFAEAWYAGVFFVAVGLGQLLLSVLLTRPLPVPVLVTGVGATAAVVALYVASRTVDLWFLPPHGHGVEHLPVAGGVGNGIPVLPGDRIEPVGALDLACLGAELVVIAMLMSLLPARVRSRTGTVLTVGAVAGVVVVAVLRST